jgi:hypothetical protein
MHCSRNAAENSDFKETNDISSAVHSTQVSEAHIHAGLTNVLDNSNVISLENSFDFFMFLMSFKHLPTSLKIIRLLLLQFSWRDLMLDCWLEVSCIRKVLRLANSIKVFRGFPWSQGKCWVVTQIPRCTACFPCSPPNGNVGNFVLH